MSLLRYEGVANRWWAFQQMGLSPFLFQDVPGLKMSKLMGSGGGNGFSIRPNLGAYALLMLWESEAAAQQFFTNNPWWQRAIQHNSQHHTTYMRTIMAHGQWAGKNPFDAAVPFDAEQPVAVITRATIKLRHLVGFWRYVPRVSAQAKDRPGQMLSIGIGEWPLFMQATFSIWSSANAMMDYAYRHPYHKEVVQKTRELGWYKEELFARFQVIGTTGTWEGAEGANALSTLGQTHPN